MKNLPSPLYQEPCYNISDLPLLVEDLKRRLAKFGINYKEIVINKENGSIYVITEYAEGALETEILNKLVKARRDLYSRSSKEVK